jgi:hypothetical protein
MWRVTGAESATDTNQDILSGESMRVFANICTFLRRMTIPESSITLYNLVLGIRREVARTSDKHKLQDTELLAMAKILIDLGYMSRDRLDKESISKQELVADVNIAISESHL